MNEADSNAKSSMTRSTSGSSQQIYVKYAKPGRTLRLEFDPWDGDLLDQTNESGDDDIHKVSVETLAVDLQASETNLASGGERVTELLDGTDELVGGPVVLDTLDETLELRLKLLGVLLPLVVLLKQSLGIIVHALGLSVGGSRGNVTGLVQESVDIVVDIVKEELELVVLLDILGSLTCKRLF